MKGPVERALEAAVDGVAIDWDALERDADPEARATLRELRSLTELARAHVQATPRPTLPFRWGPLEVRAHVAQGAHGDVYRAWDPRLHREVALKLLRDAASDDDGEPSAIDEGRRLARIRHLNVVTVYGADKVDGQAGIWMELIEGEPLSDLVARHGALDEGECVRIGAAVCDGLEAIHRAGLLHRDIKAQNVMRDTTGRILLMDFGAVEEHTRPLGNLEGTPLYLAPEVLAGGRATVASDIYSVGVLLSFLATGRYPVTAGSIEELRAQPVSGGRRKSDRIGLPGSLAAVVDRALAPDPRARFSTAAAMRCALEAARTPRRPARGTLTIGMPLVLLTTAALTVLGMSRPALRNASTAGTALIPVPAHPLGGPTADGRLASYVDRDGQLMLWDVRRDRSTRVLEGTPEGRPVGSHVSPNGGRIAYGWQLADGSYELRSIDADGQWPRLLIGRQPHYQPIPVDWTSDGRSVLCWLRQKDGSGDLVLVPDEGGPARHLHTFRPGGLVQARLSPDGRFVVASARESDSGLGPLAVIATDGSGVRSQIVEAMFTLPDWMPDGRHVFVLREADPRRETRAAWVYPVTDGVLGEPSPLGMEGGAPLDLWVTSDGRVHRTGSETWSDIYSVSLDLRGGARPGAPTRLTTRDVAHQVAPVWSPDGASLAYIVREGPDTPGITTERSLRVLDLASGQSRQVPVNLEFLGGYVPSWTPDSRAVAVWGRDGAGVERFGYHLVDVRTGKTTALVRIGISAPTYSQFTPDGLTFVYFHPERGIMARELAGGTERVLIPRTAASRPGMFALSPDGGAIAFAGNDGQRRNVLKVADLADLERPPKVLGPAQQVLVHGWTPDGSGIVYGVVQGERQRVWYIDVRRGTTVDLQFDGPVTPNPYRLSPDGTRLAFTERTHQVQLRISPPVRFRDARHLSVVPH